MNEISHASVKVMRSYDYCHFEIVLGVSEPIFPEGVDELRKEAQRLADKAVEQYKVAKEAANRRLGSKAYAERLEDRVKIIHENFPKSEWTPEQKATVKALEDAQYKSSRVYDYEDDWDIDF